MRACSSGAVLDVAIFNGAVVASIVPERAAFWNFLLELETERFFIGFTLSFGAVF